MIKRYYFVAYTEGYEEGWSPPFVEREESEDGDYISVEELRAWIEGLKPTDVPGAILSLYEELK